MHFFDTDDGARLAYRDAGEGLPLLALAGLTRDGRDFDYLAPHLHRDVRLIRLDSRGRGRSQWTGAASYTVVQEARDVVALLDHLGIDRVAILGTSRGGLIAMLLACTHPQRLLGICLNDVGPVLERAGLERIGGYVGIAPGAATLEEIAERLPAAMPGFHDVPTQRWREEVARHFVQHAGHVGLPYDPTLRDGFLQALAAPPADAWPLFDACCALPLALLRGAGSDVLSAEAAAAMQRRCPAMLHVDVPKRGHVPFLDEPTALDGITAWLAAIRTAMPH